MVVARRPYSTLLALGALLAASACAPRPAPPPDKVMRELLASVAHTGAAERRHARGLASIRIA